MMKFSLIALLICFLSFFSSYASENYEETVNAYIDSYRDYAVAEMYRSGIPASIKLAQGILESNAGRSELAIEANNHFGMKCGSAWYGPTYYKKDDDRDKKGQLIESCFRVFSSPYESYIEHSEFLKDPKKEYRYGILFDYDVTDYRSWAWGLKQAGYATNPKYANLLINLIEKYDLFTYDYYEGRNIVFDDPISRTIRNRAENTPSTLLNDDLHEKTINEDIAEEIIEEFENKRRIGFVNKVKVVYAKEGETLYSIGKKYGVKIKKIKRYNDIYSNEHQKLHQGDIVFLDNKKGEYNGPVYRHVVEEGETYDQISQMYGVRLKDILAKNNAKRTDILHKGDIVQVQGNYEEFIPMEDEEIEIKTIENGSKEVRYHYLKDDETLYGVAKKYDLTMERLIELNPGLSDLIYVGLKIRVE